MHKPSRACTYCRISEDREGLEYGMPGQEEDCRALAAKEDLEVGRVFIDNDIPAGTLSDRPRPDFDAMLTSEARPNGSRASIR
jgi:site-specific DNA recombinase